MNIIHILGITLLFSTSYSTVEEPKNKIQRTFLRKLQNYQPKDESKPMWNEVLADVLVNKIRIFSFKKQDKQTESIKEDLVTYEKSPLTNFISQVFFFYKKFVYDVFIQPLKPTTNNNPVDAHPEIEERNVDEMFKESGVSFSDGPKGEVEIIEPRYHGKQVLGNETEGSGNEEIDGETGDESLKECPEGTVKVNGNCVSNSKLIMMIPAQCPIGYRRDRLGYCRVMF